jgi:excisionase family DNA binding protein
MWRTHPDRCLTDLGWYPILAVVTERRDREWLQTGAAAEILGVSPSTLQNWADAGKVLHWRAPSGQRRFRRSDIEALLPPEREAS